MHTEMEVVIDCVFFERAHNELVVKELSTAAKVVIHSFISKVRTLCELTAPQQTDSNRTTVTSLTGNYTQS
jgi:hypothetical protein